MVIQEFSLVERSVYTGVGEGVEALLKDVNNFSKPEVVVNTIASSVMQELSEIIDFGQYSLKFSPSIIAKLMLLMQEEGNKQPTPPPS